MSENTAALAGIDRNEMESHVKNLLVENKLFVWPVDLINLATIFGIRIVNATFKDGGTSGLINKSAGRVTIFVKENSDPFSKRLTIAHQLAHFFLHMKEEDCTYEDQRIDMFHQAEARNGIGESGDRIEAEANYFATALLMPRDLVAAALKKNIPLYEMARDFNVSEGAMAYRVSALIGT